MPLLLRPVAAAAIVVVACAPDGAVSDGAVAMDAAVRDAGACAGGCNGLTPKCHPSGHCVGCLVDGDCPLGATCQIAGDTQASCVPGCKDASRCGGGAMLCCGGRCVDGSADRGNCGACGASCAAPHSAGSCAQGACAAAACDPGWGDCDGDRKNGCETNLRIDPASCTACGMACQLPHAVAACADGCYEAACQFGWDDCDGDAKNGCESSVLSDPANCGGCGKPCTSLPNASAQCQNAVCSLGACNQGFADCDRDPSNGCEANLAFDAAHCTACGSACPQGQFCVNGVCGTGCLMGMGPPSVCANGKDPETMSPWTVCAADCNSAWLSMGQPNGGTYHAEQICKSLGYSKVGQYGGTCNNVCAGFGNGQCPKGGSCAAPGPMLFDGGGNGGMDQFGLKLSLWVHWTCLR